MVAWFYTLEFAGMTKPLGDYLVYCTHDILSYEFTEKWNAVGDFTLTLPLDKNLKDSGIVSLIFSGTSGGQLPETGFVIAVGNSTAGADWLLCTGFNTDGATVTFTGTDLKGILNRRLIMVGSEKDTEIIDGLAYSAVSGTTKECIKTYLDNNIIAPVDAGRKIGMVFHDDSTVIGKTDDSYMSRLDPLGDVISTLCTDNDLGYKVTAAVKAAGDRKFVFRLQNRTDRTIEQNNNEPFIFSTNLGNLLSYVYTVDTSNAMTKVVFDYSYLIPTTVEGITSYSEIKGVYTDGNPTVPLNASAYGRSSRIEKYYDFSLNAVESQEVNKSTILAENTKNDIITASYEVTARFSDYKSKFYLGDRVNILIPEISDKITETTVDEVTVTYSATERGLKVVLGKQKQKPLQRIVNSMLNGSITRR